MTAVGRLALLSCLFNADAGSVRLIQFRKYLEGLGEAAKFLYVAECRTDGKPFALQGLRNVHQYRSSSVLWQKERLLNLLLKHLPDSVEAVGWLDADVLFEKETWWQDSLKLLQENHVVQPFSHVQQWPVNGLHDSVPGFAFNLERDPALFAQRFHAHGHTGYAWLARRDFIERGRFFDRCVLGGGDHVMAHGLLGHAASPCLTSLLDNDGPQMSDFRSWSSSFHMPGEVVRMASQPGTLKHLRHGTFDGRAYTVRNRRLRELGFDSTRHLRTNRSGCWEWSLRAFRFKRLSNDYFTSRLRDEQRDSGL